LARAQQSKPKVLAVDSQRLRTLPLGPADGYILSLVDGRLTIDEITEVSGLASETVSAVFDKLRLLGLVAFDGEMELDADADARISGVRTARSVRPPRQTRQPPRQTRQPPRQTRQPPRPTKQPPRPTKQPPRPTRPPRRSKLAPPLVAPPPVAPPPVAPPKPTADASIDLEPAHQEQIDGTFARLNTLDHYVLLGVARTADKKEIKRAYFELTGRFHPDRFFRKRLGLFKAKMEAIFTRMTEAHDTLTRLEKRAEYDAYLGTLGATRAVEAKLEAAGEELKKAEEIVRSIPPPPLPPKAPPAPAAPAMDTGPVSIPRMSTPSFDRESRPRIALKELDTSSSRSEMLARRLTGSSGRIRTAAVAPPPDEETAATGRASAVEVLRQRYEETVALARNAQAKKHVEAAKTAQKQGDTISAANALRVAASLLPDDPALKAAAEQAQLTVDVSLAEKYAKQAEYEEKSARWSEAAVSWRRVLRARANDATIHGRAARCLVMAGEHREAATFAQRACTLAPSVAEYRVTLGDAYLAAGLVKNAKRELEAAVKLAPHDSELAKRVKRLAEA
jgi:tetratricopeptide (TPR) repeat protein